MHVLGLQAALPESSYVSMTSALPMLRAIKGDDELERLAAAGAAADASLEEIVKRALRRAHARATSPPTSRACCASTGTRRSTSPSWALGRTAPTPTTR